MPDELIELLLVEDNPGDVELVREGLRAGGVSARLHAVGDGIEALEFLRREGRYAAAPRPDLIVLDLNLPLMDGRELLAELKRDPSLLRTPVIVLTSSSAARDVARSYELHANCYLQKPVSYRAYLAVVKAIEEFWLRAATLPPEGPTP